MKTLICMPCMDMVHTTFLRSLLSLRRVGEVNYAITCSSLIYDARNQLVRRAIEQGYDRILWLDSDMDFSPDLMERLSADMDEGREFVSALYFGRRDPRKPVIYEECGCYRMENGETTPIAVYYEKYPKDQIFPIKACGFGGVMMTVDLAKRVQERFGLPFQPALGFGEDLSFCGRVQQLGVEMFCDSRVKMGHVGMKAYTEDDYDYPTGDEAGAPGND